MKRRLDGRKVFGSQRGVTLVELMAVLLLVSVTLTGMYEFNRNQLQALQGQAEQIDLQASARAIVDLFAREVRAAGVPPGDDDAGHCGLVSASESELVVTTPSGEIAYGYSDAGLWRREGDGDQEVLVDGVDVAGSVLRYFAADGTELEAADVNDNLNDVRRIQIQLALQDDSGRHARATTNVTMRNRFFVTTGGAPDC